MSHEMKAKCEGSFLFWVIGAQGMASVPLATLLAVRWGMAATELLNVEMCKSPRN